MLELKTSLNADVCERFIVSYFCIDYFVLYQCFVQKNLLWPHFDVNDVLYYIYSIQCFVSICAAAKLY